VGRLTGKDLLRFGGSRRKMTIYGDPEKLARSSRVDAFPTKLFVVTARARSCAGGGAGTYPHWKAEVEKALKPRGCRSSAMNRCVAALAVALPFRSRGDEGGLEPHARTPRRASPSLYRDTALGFAVSGDDRLLPAASPPIPVRPTSSSATSTDGCATSGRGRGATAKERGAEVDPRDYIAPLSSKAPILGVRAFGGSSPLHGFKQLREELVGDRPAVVNQFVPRAPIRRRLNDWAGYA